MSSSKSCLAGSHRPRDPCRVGEAQKSSPRLVSALTSHCDMGPNELSASALSLIHRHTAPSSASMRSNWLGAVVCCRESRHRWCWRRQLKLASGARWRVDHRPCWLAEVGTRLTCWLTSRTRNRSASIIYPRGGAAGCRETLCAAPQRTTRDNQVATRQSANQVAPPALSTHS